MKLKKEWLSIMVRVFIPLAILWFILHKAKDYFAMMDWELVLSRIPELDLYSLLAIFLIGCIAAGFMIFYDVLFNQRLNLQIPRRKLIQYSWIANTFNNFFGFGGITGASIRAALFRRHHMNFKELLKTIAWSTPLMFAGVSVLLAFVLLNGMDEFLNFKGSHYLSPVLWGIVLFLPVYLGALRIKQKLQTKEDQMFVLKILFVSVIEWFSCFIVFFVICKLIGLDASFLYLYGLFFIGKFIGVASMVPGGMGAFDIVVIEGLAQHGVTAEDALLAVLLYRLSYFILPWIIGMVLVLKELGKDLLESTKKAWTVSESTFTNISHLVLSCSVFLSGLLLLVSHFNHLIVERIVLKNSIPDCWFNLSADMSLVIGFILVLLSRTVYFRIKMGYHLTILALLAGAFLSISKGFSLEDALFLLIISALIRLSKQQFYRKNYALRWEELGIWWLLALFFSSYYVLMSIHLYTAENMWTVLGKASPEILLVILFVSLFTYLSSPKIPGTTLHEEGQKEKTLAHLEKYQGNVHSHLLFLNDKKLYWAQDESVLFMYQTFADKIFVLGEPVGDEKNISTAIDEFQSFADAFGMKVLFYQIDKTHLSMYHDKGYSFFKLGEESLVDLSDFTLGGKKGASLRTKINRFKKNGYLFRVLTPPHDTHTLDTLRTISSDWLGYRSEKGYSLGFFDEDYLQMCEIAVLEDSTGNIIAFANLTPGYDNKKTIAIDLMRYTQASPVGTMDVLFCHIFEWSKKQGYECFDLRMAPLSNVGNSKFCFLSEKIAYKFFLYGSTLYGFSGLKRYKEKFATHWEPKYLAYRNTKTLSVTILQASLLIKNSKKIKKDLKKER